MVVTNDKEISDRAKSLRNLCLREDRRFKHTEQAISLDLQTCKQQSALSKLKEWIK